MIWLLLRVICVFPAGAGVILMASFQWEKDGSVSRRRGGDPGLSAVFPVILLCFPQARG